MKFEVFNSGKKRVFVTKDISCLPSKEEIVSMSKAGYKFKIDGKATNKKEIEDMVK